jgi:hypothetical protein
MIGLTRVCSTERTPDYNNIIGSVVFGSDKHPTLSNILQRQHAVSRSHARLPDDLNDKMLDAAEKMLEKS